MAATPVYPYGDTANTMLDMARERLNDLISVPQGYPGPSDPGQQFTEPSGTTSSIQTNPDGSFILRTQRVFNSAYLKMQKYLANLGYRLLIGDDLVIPALTANTNPDPSVQSWLSWNGFYNGNIGGTVDTSIKLPIDFDAPLKVRERVTGQNSVFIPMRCALDGIRTSSIRTVLNRMWEWRTNALYLPGATGLTDLQFRYTRRLQTLPDPNYYVPNTVWYLQTLPIPDCSSAMAWYIVHEHLILKAGEEAAAGAALALTYAQDENDKIFNDQARADQRTNNRRRPRGGQSNSGRHGYRYGL